ncbi:MAG: uroporphyrinogen-III C-methyltransferase [Eubacteriales bacterium]
MNNSTGQVGFVALVGAGPGEVSLLTLRAKELLEQAEVVVFDRLVSQEIMELIPCGRKLINVGKENNHHRIPQEEINQILVREALEGNLVVRLKGGDPFVFGRGGEEIETLLLHKIPYEVVPGITSAIAAPSFAGIPVTHRDFCSSFHVITGHQKKNEALKVDFDSLVQTKGTLIFLMGISTLKEICEGLIKAGMEGKMPAALVENGTRSNQRKVVATIESIYEKAVQEKFQSPSIIIVGKVCALSHEFDWFTTRPLHGERILVTSPTNSAKQLQKELRAFGAEVFDLPMIQIEPLPVEESLTKEIHGISEYRYLVFTSKNGVIQFFEHLEKMGKDARCLYHTKIVAVGPSTATVLKSYGVRADFVPKTYNAYSLAEELIPEIEENDKVLILRAEKGNYELLQQLEKKNIKYKELKLYKTTQINQGSVAQITQEKIIVCFTSASTVESFMQNQPNLTNVLGICIGEQTATMAKQYGIAYEVSEVATVHSMVEKILEKKER